MTTASIDIRTKRIYEAAAEQDGARVLVDRLWPRGIRKADAGLHAWMKDVAPSNELRRWFGHDPARWEGFRTRYRAELEGADEALKPLLELVRKGRVTLLYGAHDEQHNQAIVLAEFLRERLHA